MTAPPFRRRSWLPLLVLLAPVPAFAVDALTVGTARLDPPTVLSLGVQLLVTGDDDFDAAVTMRYRPSGTGAWRQGLPLFRVHPEVVSGWTVPTQFAGSILELRPDTSYEIELHATDPDGPVDQTLTLTGRTRPVPAAEPASPNVKNVSTAAALRTALAAAAPGDVIVLANGAYAGTFALNASGTAANPIVIRGASRDGAVLDGQGCAACNVLEVYGSFVHVERLTLRAASRALRFQGAGAQGNVVRRVRVVDTVLGIGARADQKDFYLCDNELEGRLSWPAAYPDDSGAHANDDGIRVEGTGHVVCHNRIIGYGDAIKTEQDGARSLDFYGNEVLSAYDNALELDGATGNVRCFRNRFTNSWAAISFQPVFGGPAYAFRNVVVNVGNEQMKFHALGTVPPQEPSGVLVFHNTFVSPAHALSLSTSATSHYFQVENNLFVGPASPASGRTVDWTGPIDHGTFDYNGWFPDAVFRFSWVGQGLTSYPNLAALKAAGVESQGVVLSGPTFASGLAAPASYTVTMAASDATLAAGSPAIDKGRELPGVNDGFTGAAPDLGALERGCPLPIYGIRPEGIDETNAPAGCVVSPPAVDGGTAADAGAGDGGAADAGVYDGGGGGAGGGGGGGGEGAGGGGTGGGGGESPDAGPGGQTATGGCTCGVEADGSIFAALLIIAAFRARRPGTRSPERATRTPPPGASRT